MQASAFKLATLAVVIGVLSKGLHAGSSSTDLHHATEEQPAPSISNRLMLETGMITLGPDETHQFGVANTPGTYPSIRWSLAEPGCSESSCGIVYDDGLFRAPHILRRERVVDLIGVPRSKLYVIHAQARLVPRSAHALAALPSPPARTAKTPRVASATSSGSDFDHSPSTPATSPALGTVLPQASGSAPRAVVTYTGGLLAIDAEGATLAEILRLVAEKTGAAITVPPGRGTDHVVAHAGPGEPKDILKNFLTGSPFAFIIVNSPDHPRELQQVLLFARDHSGDSQLISPDQTQDQTKAQTNISPAIAKASDSENHASTGAPELLPQRRPVPPEVIERLMRAKARAIREGALQPEAQPQGATPQ